MTTKRREFLLGLTAGTIAIGTGWNGFNPLEAGEAAVLEAARRQAAHRRRRIIFNNDGDDIWAPEADTLENFLATRHTPLVGTQVDSVYYCTTQSFNLFTHRTKVAEVFTSTQGKFANNHLRAFLQQGTDGLRMSSEFAHKHAMESIWTLRMNDIHDAWTPELRPKWKQDDPTRIMSTQESSRSNRERRSLWSLVDFEHPDVEPRLLEIIQEVLANYNVDGIELDFLRAPFYFRSSYEGRAASAAQTGILSNLMRAVRKLVLYESQQQGKPFLLGVRVPSTLALGRKIGIDVAAWLQEKLVDVVAVGGGYITFDQPVSELAELAHEHDVRIYPCLSQSGLLYRPPRGKGSKQPAEAWFGAAARLWQDGADGVYTFNLFPGPGAESDAKYARQVLSTIGSPNQLSSSSIMYGISDAGWWMPEHYWARDVVDYSKALPMPLKANEFERTWMHVPEDLRGAGFDVTAQLRVDFTGLTAESTPEILFGSANFGPIDDSQPRAGVRRYVCQVPLQAISQGRNRVMVKTKESGAQLAGAELWIRR